MSMYKERKPKKDSSSTISTREGSDLCEKSFFLKNKNLKNTFNHFMKLQKNFYVMHLERVLLHPGIFVQHKSDPLFSHKCETCDKKFPSSMGLRRHNQNPQMQHHCQACGKSFFHEIDLQNHIHSIHEGEEPK